MKKASFLLILAVCSLALHAQLTIECDRPDQTETPSIVPDKHFQLESGFYFHKQSDITITYPSTLIKYGIKDIAEFRFEIEPSTQIVKTGDNTNSTSGVSPIAFGMKLKICEEKKWLPKTSVIIMTSVPILASKKLTANFPSPQIRFTCQHTLPQKFTLSYNFGALWSEDDLTTTPLYTLTSGYSFTNEIGCYVELYGFMPFKGKQEHGFDGGFMFYPVPNWMIDLSGGILFEKRKPAWFAGLGISFLLPR
jgi:hypothetical protein